MEWHLDNFQWLVGSFAGRRDFMSTVLVLPAPGFFDNAGTAGHAKARVLFDQVKRYCDIDTHVDLVPDDSVSLQHGAPQVGEVSHGRHAAGLYRAAYDRNTPEITYAEHLLQDSQKLIAVFAHELAHLLLDFGTVFPPPIEDGQEEFLTDLTAVYMGFGVFMANSVLRFQQYDQGGMHSWRTARLGYLPENDLVFATAIFLKVQELDPGPAVEWLKPHLGKALKRALRDLDACSERIAQIRALA